MRRSKKLLAFILLLALFAAMVIPPRQAEAASKKKIIYVVSSIRIKGRGKSGASENYTKKITYNKYGQITKISQPDAENVTYTFTYNSNHRLTKFVQKIGKGRFKGTTTYKYAYKNGALYSRTQVGTDGDREKDVFTWKNGAIASAKCVSSWIEDGKTETQSFTRSFRYNDGILSRLTSSHGVWTYSHDEHGNFTRMTCKIGGKIFDRSYYRAAVTYNKSGRPVKMVTRYMNGMMEKEEKLTQSITYKKITVDSSYAGMVEAQQWQILNSDGATNCASDACTAW